jgi:hypothetical protein
LVLPRYLWAALDCPGGIAVSTGAQPIVLGRITGEILGDLQAGERCVVIGWEMGRDGRKRFAGTAVFNESGQLIGQAKAIWLTAPHKYAKKGAEIDKFSNKCICSWIQP